MRRITGLFRSCRCFVVYGICLEDNGGFRKSVAIFVLHYSYTIISAAVAREFIHKKNTVLL